MKKRLGASLKILSFLSLLPVVSFSFIPSNVSLSKVKNNQESNINTSNETYTATFTSFVENSDASGQIIFETCEKDRTVRIVSSSLAKCNNPVFKSKVKVLQKEYTLTAIGAKAFFQNDLLTGTLTLPFSLLNIGDYAFSGCSNLSGALKIPDSIIFVGDYAFSNCSGFNSSLVLSKSLKEIRSHAFENCSGFIGNLLIPEHVTKIGDNAFSGCGNFNKIVDLPNELTTISNYAFSGCNKISNEINIPENVTTIGDYAFSNCSGILNINLNEKLQSIGSYAFSGCGNLTGNVAFSKNITTIGDYAFNNCKLLGPSVSINKSICDIGKNVFNGCSNLTLSDNILYSTKNKDTYKWCFGSIGATKPTGSLKIDSDTDIIAKSAFANNTNLTGNLILPTQLIKIEDDAFSGCSGLTAINLGLSLEKIGNQAFNGCSGLTGQLLIPQTTNSIGYNAFKGTNFSLDVNNILYSAGGFSGYKKWCIGAIKDSKPTFNITLQNNTYGIASGAFENCDKITNFYTENNVYFIGDYAFSGCSSLKSFVFPNQLEHIGDYAFSGCSSLTNNENIVFPNNLLEIGDYAFSNCSGLKNEVDFNEQLKTIGDYAFFNCSKINKINFNNQNTKIGIGAFSGCSGLTEELNLPKNLTAIPDHCFENCKSIELVYPQELVTVIGNYAFSGCDNLKRVRISSNVKKIGDYAFNECSNIDTLLIANGVNEIGKWTFNRCSKLQEINLPKTITLIDDYAFSGCYVKKIEFTSLTPPNFGYCWQPYFYDDESYVYLPYGVEQQYFFSGINLYTERFKNIEISNWFINKTPISLNLTGQCGVSGEASGNFQVQVNDGADPTTIWNIVMTDGKNKPDWLHISDDGLLYWDDDCSSGTYNFYLTATSKVNPRYSDSTKTVTLTINGISLWWLYVVIPLSMLIISGIIYWLTLNKKHKTKKSK